MFEDIEDDSTATHSTYSSVAAAAFFLLIPSYFWLVRAFLSCLYADASFSAAVIARASTVRSGLGTGIISLRVFCATFCSSDLAVSPFLQPFLPAFFGKIFSLDK